MKKNIDKNKDKDIDKNEEVKEEKEVKSEEEKEKSDIEKLQDELKTQKDLLLRTAAEYDNYRTRTKNELVERYEDAKVSVIKKMLTPIDNFGRAIENQNASEEDYKKGVEMIYRQFNDTLKELGIEEFGEVGESFDANLHNAVMHIEDENLDDNVIAEVFQKGYKLGDKVIRYATVKVAN
jgi:molecular chaperone GrpE